MTEEPSYRKINYAIRPAKNIERKMMAEAFASLRSFCRVSAYRYIGFGSTFFSDFTLFHRQLGIQSMISIEGRIEDQERFQFNKPLGCIGFEFGQSSEVLPTLDWVNIPTIIWLDYDKAIDRQKLNDVKYVVANLCPGSVWAVTVRAKAGDFGANPKARLAGLKRAMPDSVPSLVLSDLSQKSFPRVVQRIVGANVTEVVSQRNAALSVGRRFDYEQLFFFEYNDGTPMVTVGGILMLDGQRASFNTCDFKSLDFCRSGNDPYKIRVPSLTYKELRHLETMLPSSEATSPGVPVEDVADYGKVYRYFPKFVEAEM